MFTGVSFGDHKNSTVESKRNRYTRLPLSAPFKLKDTTTTLVCGTKTETSSGWMLVGGPIKGSYIVKVEEDNLNDYISDFGVYVEDPCQAVDDKVNIISDP